MSFLFFSGGVTGSLPYESLGCYKFDSVVLYEDSLERKPDYVDRNGPINPIRKCYQAAKSSVPSVSIFVISYSGRCSFSGRIDKTYDRMGTSGQCPPAGTGSVQAMNAYKIRGKYLEY